MAHGVWTPRRRTERWSGTTVVPAIVIAVALLVHLAAGSSPFPPRAVVSRAASTTLASHRFTLEWVGDIALSLAQGLPPHGVGAALAPVAPLLRDADLTVGNLEGTLGAAGDSKCAGSQDPTCFAFQAPPKVARELRTAGFDVVNQANNHSEDFGDTGRTQTLAALSSAGLPYTGLPGQITVVPVHGLRVGLLGFAPYDYDADLRQLAAAQALIRKARTEADVVVVIIHAGAEGADAIHTPAGEETYLGEDRGDTRAFARAAIDAGASVVLGSGPHVPRGVEAYRGHLIAYSLGNFLGYNTLGQGGPLSESGILRVELDGAGDLIAARWISVRLSHGLPAPDPSGASARLVNKLSAEDFPQDHYEITPRGAFRARRL